jgi:2-hydroxychromene-2-carboxylate isomerase
VSPRSPGDALRRRVLPRTVVALSRADVRGRAGAPVRRALRRPARVELYFAFDDPCSAVAVVDLANRLAAFDVVLALAPVVRRGIADDPAVELKRRYAVEDATRLFRRSGLVLGRGALAPQDVAFLAGWAASATPGQALTTFCVAASRRLWLTDDGPVLAADYRPLWRRCFGTEPPEHADAEEALRRNERRMGRRGPYDTPAAWVHGQWFFAHDRLPQIAARLDGLGARRAA